MSVMVDGSVLSSLDDYLANGTFDTDDEEPSSSRPRREKPDRATWGRTAAAQASHAAAAGALPEAT